MPLEVPNLDDRTWAELVDKARSLIPRESPRWTDHNLHDPGITFIEMFAWLAEMQLYQLNRVGERQREAFAQLAGVSREGRKPAHVNIHVEGTPQTGTFIPAGTQVVPADGQEIVFETDTDLFLTRTRLEKVLTDDGSGPVDHTQANEKPGIAFLAFGETAATNAELRLGFDRFYPGEQPQITLTAEVFTDDLVEQCGTVGPIDLEDAEETAARVDLAWEYLGAGQRWLPLQVISDRTGAFAHSGDITFAVPEGAVAERNLFWIRARVRAGYYDIEPRLRSISLNVLPCVQKETVRLEAVGEGSGKPDQLFTLKKKPVLIPELAARKRITSNDVADWEHLARQLTPNKPELAGRIRDSFAARDANNLSAFTRINDLNQQLAATDGPKAGELNHLLGRTPVVIEIGNEIWRPVSSFTDSGPRDKHYIFNPETGGIEFGNGLNGEVPKKGEQVRALWYQTSSGSSGNVAKDLNWRFAGDPVAGVDLINRESGAGGTDPETLAVLELRTRALLDRPYRAVTLKDLEQLALSTRNAYVARAKAIVNCPVPETITVVAVPKLRPGRKGPPRSPSPMFLTKVNQHLQQRRILCDSLRVVPPVYVEVKVSARLRLTKGASEEGVLTRAREAIDSFLRGELTPADKNANRDSARRTSTPSSCFSRWPFGRSVFPSEVYAILDDVTGVDFASNLVLIASRGGVAVQANSAGAIPIPLTGLVFPGEHNFTVEFDTRRTA